MTLIEQVYDTLYKHALVETAEEFSTEWCLRSKSWHAVHKNKHGDFSIPAAINCLNRVKIKLTFIHFHNERLGGFADGDVEVLRHVRDLLEAYLLEHHRIAVVTEAPEIRDEATV